MNYENGFCNISWQLRNFSFEGRSVPNLDKSCMSILKYV